MPRLDTHVVTERAQQSWLPDARAVRIARHTERLDEVVEFYRDGLGLIEIAGFRGHAGYDGVVLAVPDTRAHLELTAGGEHGVPVPHPESLFVLYLGDVAAVKTTLRRLGVEPIAPANPYWAEHGVTVADPDGFRVVLVPEWWAPFGDGGNAGTPAAAIRVDHYEGPRANLRPLFELAEDSQRELDAYIGAGRVLIAAHEGEVVGHIQLTETAAPGQLQIRNMAVTPSYQRRGVGRALLAAAIALAREEERSTLVVATAAADIGNLRFYQRLGFRMRSVERDAFTAATGYSAGLLIDGIELRDRVWLELPS